MNTAAPQSQYAAFFNNFLRLRSVLVVRNDARPVISEFVRATVKQVKKVTAPAQARLPLAVY
jgi:hypothetical protein